MKNKTDPSFVNHFKSRGLSLIAVNMIINLKRSGYTNRQILNYPGFLELFKDGYFEGKSFEQKEWKLKNIARDLKKLNYDDINYEWVEAKGYFEGKRRNS